MGDDVSVCKVCERPYDGENSDIQESSIICGIILSGGAQRSEFRISGKMCQNAMMDASQVYL